MHSSNVKNLIYEPSITYMVKFSQLCFSRALCKQITNPTMRGILTLHEEGALKAPPEEKLHIWHIFVIQLIRKNLTFPKYL